VSWHWITLVYLVYLVVASLLRSEFARARPRLVAVAMILTALTLSDVVYPLGPASSLVVIPSLVLLGGYRMSGMLFVRVDARAEAWLRQSDDRWFWRTGILPAYDRAPIIVREFFELSYLLVYAALPAGAIVLLASGHAVAAARYWTAVLLAEFACYAVLPWVQTRPPMLLETRPAAGAIDGPVRRFNQAIAARGSIHANTIPSGHAAGAFACALAISDALPAVGVAFAALAVSIATASVLGRYHYAADAVLGLAVAIGAWMIV
jgi:membrane-associated phospholipid phosphatase